ncbi:hypothetical protein BH10BAC2_BH10BAC2_20530 [soil metagenome]
MEIIDDDDSLKKCKMNFKEERIENVLQHLLNKFPEKLLVRDFWEADNCAIGLANQSETKLVYISIWEKPADLFFVALETSATNIKKKYDHVENFENVRIGELEELVKKHLILE